MKYKIILITGAVFLLLSCTKIDDYMLGKDNTPKPSQLPNVAPNVRLVERWSVPIGNTQKVNHYLKLSPVIRGNILYSAGTSGLVQAMDKQTGKAQWSHQLTHNIISGPVVSEGYIVLATDVSSIVVLNAKNGNELWTASISGDALAKPTVAKQKVIVKTIDGNVYAFNLKNGKKLWTLNHGAPNLILKASSSPVVHDNVVFVGFSDGRLDAVELQSGTTVWQRGIAHANGASDVERLVDIDADPIIRGNTLFLAGYQGYVGAISLSSGEFLWRKPASTYKNFILDENTLYMTDTSDVIWALDRHNGQVQWKQLALKARGLTEPVLMGSHLFVGDKTGYLHALSKKEGEFQSRVKLGGPIVIAPVASESSVYVIAKGQLNRYSVS